MKKTSIVISRLVLVAFAVGGLSLIHSVRGQADEHPTTDNPHLRPASRTQGAEPTKQVSKKDQDFMIQAATGGAQEVEDGNTAAKRGQSPAVKKIGMRMAADHSKGTKELIALAKKKGFTISTSTVKPRNFDTGNFDKQYLASMQQDHEQDIKAYQKEAQSGDDSEVKAWAAKNLPTLKEHLAMVKSANHK